MIVEEVEGNLNARAKAAITAALVATSDQLFYGQEPGLNLGLLGWVLSATALAAFPALRRES